MAVAINPDEFFGEAPAANDASERVPPHDDDAEQAVLGSVLYDEARLAELDGLEPEHFFSEGYRRTFEAIRAVAKDGASVSLVAVAAKLRELGRLEQVGGSAALHEIVTANAVLAPKQLASVVGIVRDRHRARQAIAIGHKITALGYAGCAAEAFITSAVEELGALRPPPSPLVGVLGPTEIFTALPEQPFAVDGLMIKGALAMIVAYGESLKSWMALDAVLAMATGARWLGRFQCEKGPALFIDYEAGDYEVRRRIQRIAAARELAAPVQDIALVSFPDWLITSDEFFARVEKFAERYALIVVDSLTGAAGKGDENEAGYAAALYRLKSIASRTSCLIVVLHHSRKANAAGGDVDPREMVRGSSAIFNAVDVCLYLRRHGESDGFLCVQTKARGGKKVDPFVLRVDDESPAATSVLASEPEDEQDDTTATSDAFTAVRGKVVRLLAHDHDCRSASEICRRVKGTRKTALEAVKELEERGVITKVDGVYRLRSEVAS
jgi:hypothetical protein